MSFLGENKPEIGFMAAGGTLGGIIGNQAYKKTPSKMVTKITREGLTEEFITPKFIDYAIKSKRKELFRKVDPHTSIKYFKNEIDALKRLATPARKYPTSNERYHFQDLYNLGKKYLTNRKTVPYDKIDKAKQGAQIIEYARKYEKTMHILKGGIIGGLLGLCVIKAIEIGNQAKEQNTSFKDVILSYLPKKAPDKTDE